MVRGEVRVLTPPRGEISRDWSFFESGVFTVKLAFEDIVACLRATHAISELPTRLAETGPAGLGRRGYILAQDEDDEDWEDEEDEDWEDEDEDWDEDEEDWDEDEDEWEDEEDWDDEDLDEDDEDYEEDEDWEDEEDEDWEDEEDEDWEDDYDEEEDE